MKVALELGLNVEAPRGADVYYHGLVQGLRELKTEHRFVLFSYFYKDFAAKAAKLPGAGANVELAYKRWPERLVRSAEALGLPVIDRLFVRPSGADLYHGLGGVPPRLSVPTVTTVYDLLPEVLRERAAARGESPPPAPPSCGAQAQRADRIITISAATRDDLVRFYGVDANRVTVVHLGVDHAMFKPAPEAGPSEALPEKYVLFVGPFEYRRNAEAGLQAVAAMKARGLGVVLVGKMNAYGESLRRLAASLGLADRAVFTGFVPREDLPRLYSRALAFVHPEHYDGYSLQLLEAMACGAPAVISGAPALTEIAQGDALICGTDAASVRAQLERLLDEPGLREAMRARSLARAATFSWKKTAEQTVAVYEELIR
ncbi:MAG: glycosyltransferase family 4 protein [Elusimicrobia bacterium]|nr:glycosyltransferase family 4 protein [Elusimicrobiota bacterium]